VVVPGAWVVVGFGTVVVVVDGATVVDGDGTLVLLVGEVSAGSAAGAVGALDGVAPEADNVAAPRAESAALAGWAGEAQAGTKPGATSAIAAATATAARRVERECSFTIMPTTRGANSPASPPPGEASKPGAEYRSGQPRSLAQVGRSAAPFRPGTWPRGRKRRGKTPVVRLQFTCVIVGTVILLTALVSAAMPYFLGFFRTPP
jgi:hypothetical protein